MVSQKGIPKAGNSLDSWLESRASKVKKLIFASPMNYFSCVGDDSGLAELVIGPGWVFVWTKRKKCLSDG